MAVWVVGSQAILSVALRIDTECLFRLPLGIITLSSVHNIFTAQAASKGLGDGPLADNGCGTDGRGSGFQHCIFHCAPQNNDIKHEHEKISENVSVNATYRYWKRETVVTVCETTVLVRTLRISRFRLLVDFGCGFRVCAHGRSKD